jgi:hypothetical protein
VSGNSALSSTSNDTRGGGIFNAATGVLSLINGTSVVSNTATGGNGSNGGAGIDGGIGRSAFGGGIYNNGGEVDINGSSVLNNSANGGAGGLGGNSSLGGNGGNGGNGGAAQGGGIFSNGGAVTILNGLVKGNRSVAGKGGNGGNAGSSAFSVGGNGGTAGTAAGGGIYLAGGPNLLVVGHLFVSGNSDGGVVGNQAIGGNGGNGGNGFTAGAGGVGGNATGGDLITDTGTVTLLNVTLGTGVAQAGAGGAGGKGSVGGVGGNGGAAGSALGGAVYTGGNLTATDCMLTGNKALGASGGIGGADGAGRSSTANAVVGGAGSLASGGGLFSTGGSVTVDKSTFAQNAATGGAGGAGASPGAVSTSSKAGINGGIGGIGGAGQGGALANLGGVFSLTNSTFDGNQATGGAGGNGGSGGTGQAGFNGGVGGIGGNGGDGDGGALYLTGGNETVMNNTLASGGVGLINSATGGTGGNGGAGGIGQTGGNGGDGGVGGQGLGGNINNAGGNLTFDSNTVTQGQATFGNGGRGGTGGTTNSTGGNGSIGSAGAVGDGLGGGVDVTGGRFQIFNSLIAGNTASAGAGVASSDVAGLGNLAGVFVSQGHNLIGDGTDSSGFLTTGATPADLVGTAANPINPGLDTTLKNNGGPTQTLALLAGSQAINFALQPPAKGKGAAGTIPPTDQRGVLRPATPSSTSPLSIGAYQFTSATQHFATLALPTSPTSPSPNAPTAFATTSTTFNLGSFTDVTTSANTSWTVSVDWGDKSTSAFTVSSSAAAGTKVTVPLGSLAHTYAINPIGVYMVTETITNSQGVQTEQSFLVSVGSLTVTPSAPTVVVGKSVNLTVSVLDAFGHAIAGFTGPVVLTSTGAATFSDPATGLLPGGLYTFVPGDLGVHVFSLLVPSGSPAGQQTITVAGTTAGGPSGTTILNMSL